MHNIQQLLEQQLQQLKWSGNYRRFLEIKKSAAHFPRFYYTDEAGQARSAINWCSNDYLAMSVNDTVIKSFSFAAYQGGVGSGGTRNISGTTAFHKELEHTLAQWHGKQDALLFGSAYMANASTLQTLGELIPNLIFISDEKNHASIIEGIRNSRCRKIIFRHNDTEHLQNILENLPALQPRVVVFESVYSICGSIAPVQQILELAGRYQALTYIDEVHAVGLYGATGAGICQTLPGNIAPDIINGTLAKGIGVYGGYIAASRSITDAIRSFGKGFIFTSSLPPAVCSAAVKSIHYIQSNDALRQNFFTNVQLLRQRLHLQGIAYQKNQSHITPIRIGNSRACKKNTDTLLLQHGIYVQPINHPTVKQGEECIRIIISAAHTQSDIEQLCDALHGVLHQNFKTVSHNEYLLNSNTV